MFTLYDEFAGWGGSSQGATAVPGVEMLLAANHDPLSVEVHGMNFPGADHYCGDIAKADIAGFPRADLFWASPACPPWTDARGVKRDFDQATQNTLFDPVTGPIALDPAVARARALMEEIPRYLQAMRRKGKPVLGGVVENVVQVRKWAEFGRWRREIEAEGYRTRLVAINSMHVAGPVTGKVAQSRNRFYMPFWLAETGRNPDWDKWLRPRAYCPACDEEVIAMQSWKKPGTDMGVYGILTGQYVYRCPRSTCRNTVIEPPVLGAETIIDWSLDPGQRIGERVDGKGRPDPLEPATIARIEAGLAKHVRPLLAPAGGTWRNEATPLDRPLPTRTTRETDGLVVPPMVVSVAKRAGDSAVVPVDRPLRTQTCRRENALVIPPFISLMRGGGSREAVYPTSGPIPTVSAQGNHHALIGPPAGERDTAMLLAYYSNGTATPVDQPAGTLTTRDRYALVGGDLPVDKCTFRMLAPEEIGAGMAFRRDYKVKGSKRRQVRGYGNAVTPPVAEVLVSALVETLSGEALTPAG